MADLACHDCRQTVVRGSRCPECRIKHRDAERRRKEQLRDQGKCLFCGAPLRDDTFVLCLGCRLRRKQLREQLKQLNAEAGQAARDRFPADLSD